MQQRPKQSPKRLSMGGMVPRSNNSTVQVPKKKATKQLIDSSKKTKKKANRLFRSYLVFLRNYSLYIIALIAVAGLYIKDLNKLPPLPSSNLVSLSGDSFLSVLKDSLAFAPQKLLDYSLLKLGWLSPLTHRFISLGIVTLSVLVFYFLVKIWTGRRIAILSTILFASSTWTIYQARQDNFNTSYIILIPLLLLFGTTVARGLAGYKLFFATMFATITIYIPGAIWLFLLGLILYLAHSTKMFANTRTSTRLLIMLGFIVCLAPIVYFSVLDSLQLAKLAGLQTGHFPQIQEIKENIRLLPSELFVSGLNTPFNWLPGTPIIDGASLVFLLAGFMHLVKAKNQRFKKTTLFSIFTLLIALIAVIGSEYISALLPIIYLFMAFGISFLLDQWLSIFPSNPLARSVGLIIISLIVILISGYHVSRYYVAWPKTDAYKQVFIE